MMRFSLVLIVFPITAVAYDPIECVDPDMADAFLGYRYENRPEYSTSVPAGFFNTELPADIELIGSKSSGANTTVVYKSRQKAEVALSGIVKVMEDAGWKDLTKVHRGFHGGFRSQSMPVSATMCHDSRSDAMNIMAREKSGRTLLSFSVYRLDQPQTCGELASDSRMYNEVPLSKYLPTLNIPAGAKSSGTGSGGGGDEYSSRAVVSTTMSRDGLLAHFDDQIRDQHWVPDTGWSGSTSSGTVWSKTGRDDEALVGILRITEASTEVFNVRFTVTSVDPGNYFSGTIRSSSSQ